MRKFLARAIKADNAIYILELKVDDSAKVLEQIKQKKYHLKFTGKGEGIYFIGINFDSARRNLSPFEWEKAQ